MEVPTALRLIKGMRFHVSWDAQHFPPWEKESPYENCLGKGLKMLVSWRVATFPRRHGLKYDCGDDID